MNINDSLARRDFLKGTGALVMGFALTSHSRGETTLAQAALKLGPYGPPEDEIDSWISIAQDGTATLYSGCCELGTGSSTGLLQVMAEELDIPFEHARLIGPDTNRTVDQFVSSGSRTISAHSRPIRQAAAEARAALVDLAAKRLSVPAERLVTDNGVVSVKDAPEKKVSYGELIGSRSFNLKVTGKVKPKEAKDYKIVGKPVKRLDTPAKVFGTFIYVQDVKVPNMLHGRVVRPPSHGATAVSIDESSVSGMPGFVKLVREHDLIGVVCEREEQAIRAAQALKVKWSDWAGLPDMKDLYTTIRRVPEFPSGYADEPSRPGGVIANVGDVQAALAKARKVVKVTYTTPYHSHGSIGPSCAVADVRADGVTIWSGTQTPYGLREACAKFLGLGNDKVRLIYVEASGCYGQNGADDVVIDALVMSRAVSRPVRVQWMRQDENGWEAYKSARWFECQGGIDKDGKIIAWDTRTWGFSGYSRPEYHEPVHGGEPGSLVTAQLAGWGKPGLEEGFGGASNNFEPVYTDIPNRLVKFTYLGPTSHRQGPLRIRVGSMRGVGSPDNIFGAETFMDELAVAADADPLEFRLRHKPTERMQAVFKAAAERANWQTRPSHSRPARGELALGRGIAALGSPRDTNVVGILEVAVNPKTGVVRVNSVVVAVDCGLIVNPNAVTDQVEGGIIQNISRALWEEVTFNRSRVTSLDWSSYRTIKFSEIPDVVEVVLLDRPDQPPQRVGEPPSEVVWPALSNAIYDAIGVRMRDMPFTPARVMQALSRPRQGAL